MTSRERLDSLDSILRFIEELKEVARGGGQSHLVRELEDALSISTSVLETIGALKDVLVKNREDIEKLIPSHGGAHVDDVIRFVKVAYGNQ